MFSSLLFSLFLFAFSSGNAPHPGAEPPTVAMTGTVKPPPPPPPPPCRCVDIPGKIW